MMLPDVGMNYEDVRKRLKRMKDVEIQGKVKNERLYENVKKSLLNQSRLCDGDTAVNELVREIDCNNHSTPRTGYSPKYAEKYKKIFG